MLSCPLNWQRGSRWLLLLPLLGLIACRQEGTRRYDISGEVTYQGQPVPLGEISFDPVEGGIGGGFASIENGRFDTRIDGRGHLGGAHRVQIVGFGEWIDASDPDKGALPLFDPFETTVELATGQSTLDFVVPASGDP